MKKLFSIFLLLIVVNLVNAQTLYPSGVTNCIARWIFASSDAGTLTLPDVGNNGNNGTIYNLTNTPGFRNKPNEAMYFNGTNSYALVNDAAILSPHQFTGIALVRFDNFYSGGCQNTCIFSKGYPDNIPGDYCLRVTDNVYDNGNCYSFDSLHTQLVGGTGTNATTMSPSNYIKLHDWYFVAFTFNGHSSSLYQVVMDTAFHANNITPIYTAYTPNAVGAHNQALAIGMHLDPQFPYWFGGAMDEVALFNKALSDTEIQSVYDYLWGYPPAATSVEHIAATNEINIYPNPSNGIFTITNPEPKDYTIRVVNQLGQEVYRSEMKNEKTKTINLEHLSSGNYAMQVGDGRTVYTKILAIMH